MRRLLAGGLAAALAVGASLVVLPVQQDASALQGAQSLAAAAQVQGSAAGLAGRVPFESLRGRESDVVNDEIVVSQLDPRGLPIRSQLISRLSSKAGPERTIHDPTSTTNIVYLNQRGRPTVSGDGIEVQVGGSEPTVVLTEALVDKPLPVALHAEYRLDGQVVDANQIVGATGEVAVRYTVTNTDVKTKTITYTDGDGRTRTQRQPVFAPFVGTLTVTLPEAVRPTNTKSAIVSTNKDGTTILTWQLLLYPPMGNYQQSVSFTSQMDDGAVPGVALTVAPAGSTQDPSVAFTSDLLSKSADGNEQLAGGLEQLNASTIQLAQGAAQLATGIAQLADGTTQLASGQDQLSAGIGQAAGGSTELASGLAAAVPGSSQLADGLALVVANLPTLVAGVRGARDGAAALADAVGSADDPPLPTPTPSIPPGPTPIPTPGGEPVFPTPSPTATPSKTPTLVQAVRALAEGAEQLTDQVVALSNDLIEISALVGDAGEGSAQVTADAGAAGDELEQLLDDLCPPPGALTQQQCDSLEQARELSAAAESGSQGVTGTLQETGQRTAVESLRAYALAFGAHGLTEGLVQVQQGAGQIGTGLRSGSDDPEKYGLVEGLDALLAGVRQLAKKMGQAADGAGLLSDGLAAAAGGSDALATGLGQLATGSTQLAAGTRQLAFGADQAASGAAQLATGAGQLQREGTQRIYRSVVQSSAQPALAAAYLQVASDRASSALPYGLPDGATGSAAYVMTMEPVAGSDTTAWQLGALGLLLVAGIGGAVLKTLQSHRQP